MRERNSSNFLAINQPFLSELFHMFVVKVVGDRDMRFIPTAIPGLVSAN